jgi:hypothetical protein
MFDAGDSYLIDSFIFMLQKISTREGASAPHREKLKDIPSSLRGGRGLGEASGAGGTACGKYNWFIHIVSLEEIIILILLNIYILIATNKRA